MRLAGSVEIGAPAALVFGVLSAPERLPEWNPSVVRARRVTAAHVELGSHAEMEGTLLGQRLVSETEVVQFDPPRLFATRAVRGPRVATVFRLEALAAGCCVSAEVDGDVPGGKLGGLIAERLLRTDFLRSLEQLKGLCEDEARRRAASEPLEGGDPACWLDEESVLRGAPRDG